MQLNKPSLYVRLRALADAGHASVVRARGQGMSWGELLGRAAAAFIRGPRFFARQVICYVAPEVTAPPTEEHRSEYGKWIEAQPSSTVQVASFGRVSVIMPVCETPETFLLEAYASLRAQSYCDWELCIHDDASIESRVRTLLERLVREDDRIRISYGAERGGIAKATNAALALASGRWVAFLDHDDLLHPEALALTATRLAEGDCDLVYTDHDALDESGQRCLPYFKPDWNPDLFLSQMYLGHLVVIDRTLVESVGRLRPEMDGAQDYDLVLRCVSAGARIAHVPQVLYHWRQHSGSTSANAGSKPYAHHAGRRALQEYVDLHHPGAHVDDGAHTFCYDVRYPVDRESTLASIIIPTRDRIDLLDVCIRTLRELTRGQQYEVMIVDNGSVEPESQAWLARMQASGAVRVIRADVPFNWSVLNNLAAREASGDVLVFLNNDTEIVEPGWLARLVEVALRPDVGVCGPLLVYGDGTIQHAGVVVGMGGWADHVFKGMDAVHSQHLFASPMLRRNVLAVTGACMAVDKRTFDSIGGFDESFVICGSDVELCLRAHASGLRNVYIPEAKLIHHESKTRDPRAIPEEDFVRSAAAYHPYRTEGDPYYNANLDPMSAVPALKNIP